MDSWQKANGASNNKEVLGIKTLYNKVEPSTNHRDYGNAT